MAFTVYACTCRVHAHVTGNITMKMYMFRVVSHNLCYLQVCACHAHAHVMGNHDNVHVKSTVVSHNVCYLQACACHAHAHVMGNHDNVHVKSTVVSHNVCYNKETTSLLKSNYAHLWTMHKTIKGEERRGRE